MNSDHQTISSATNNSNNNDEAFFIFFNGSRVTVAWQNETPPFSPILRLCSISPTIFLLLNQDKYLYEAKFDHENLVIEMKCIQRNVIDVQYCRIAKEVFLVLGEGSVVKQRISDYAKPLEDHLWLPVIFDPLELSEDGVRIKRICSSSEATIFLSNMGDIYALGNCGVHFSVECEQPKLLRLFKKGLDIIDIAAGEQFFIFLTRKQWQLEVNQPIAVQNYGELPDLLRSEQCNKNTSNSMHSSTISTVLDMETSIQNLLQQGYSLLHTQIFSMGSNNKGLLGTGDHIKRDSLYNVQKLKEVGVCSLATGKTHTVVRTIDGRLYHWGFNDQKQLTNNEQIFEISSPTELSFDSSDLDVPRVHILEACCGDYRTVLLNTQGEIFEKNKQTYSQEKDFLTMQMKDISQQSYPLLLASHQLTLYNRRYFKRQYHTLHHHIQNQLKLMMSFRKKFLQLNQIVEKVLKDLHEVCHHWENVLYLVITILHSLEQFYRGDYDQSTELVVIKYYRECIQIFELYTKAYCDTYSVDGFNEAYQLFNHSYPPTTSAGYKNQDLLKMFQQPFLIFPYVIQLLEHIQKHENICREELLAWNEFSRRNRIDLELADNTRDFWRSNLKNTKVLQFKTKERRVILSSTAVPIKLSHVGFGANVFILFSDFLCQHSSQITALPLNAMWLRKEEAGIRIITPEKNFVLTSKNKHDIELWYDQLEITIKTVLMLSEKSKIPEVRMIDYNFAPNHAIYGGVYVKGNFSNGVMHGKCRLEYPNGKMYSGDVIHGVIEGYGRMFIPKVGLYKGNLKNGKFWGHGTLIINEKELYEGNFRNGLFNGHGHKQHSDYVYIGEFVDNQRCGYGVLDRIAAGEKYLGLFADNKRVGSGVCISSTGDYFEGSFANDELTGRCIAIFPNGFYYEGESTLNGPSGLGKYYMPVGYNKQDEDNIDMTLNSEMMGNILSGQLTGTWENVRINAGTMEINRKFTKYPSAFGSNIIDNSRKWCSLFDDFENELFGDLANATPNTKPLIFALWNRVIAFISKQQELENEKLIPRELDITNISTANVSSHNNNKKGFLPLQNITKDFDKLSLNSSLLNFDKLELSRTHSHSEDTLNGLDFSSFDLLSTFNKLTNLSSDDSGGSHTYSTLMDVMENCNNITLDSFNDSALSNSVPNEDCISLQTEMDLIPQFGMSDLNDQELIAIKEYLRDAFRYRYHPFKHLNERITHCFYRSYGCWKIKPTPLLAQQAMREWESISQRVYKFIRRLFPALPEEYSVVGENREVVSHITLLYPILLSEGIYSTLFVLYANKYSHKDEIYRQNLLQAEKLNDNDLMQYLEFDSNILLVVNTDTFLEAIKMLKELKEKYTPMAMLTVIENCMEKITLAYQTISSATKISLNADLIMPLSLILLLRAAIPHLGAELALLDDLTDCKNFQFEMNGIRGYCYTTLKASYEHIATKTLFEKK
ncbi:alsin homolog [Lucilia sericata]|uniref:alsin homolog n=1 Tax=Lucilia sericata TaxID=13632 RepID=UPI0018A86894|nr:alsin homolog [Lucilia sericata]